MKRFLLLLGIILFASNANAYAQEAIISDDGSVVLEEKEPSKYRKAVNRIKVKRYAKKFVKAKVNKDNQKAHDELAKFFDYGGANTKIKIYSPCPCRGKIDINGKSVDAKLRRCVVLSYEYLDEQYEVGKCGKPINKKAKKKSKKVKMQTNQ